MEQYTIGVSELDIERSNLQETSGVYKINHADIGKRYYFELNNHHFY